MSIFVLKNLKYKNGVILLYFFSNQIPFYFYIFKMDEPKVYESIDRVKEFIEKSATGYRYYCDVRVRIISLIYRK